jgi:mono/diheme cytochrome c family protein
MKRILQNIALYSVLILGTANSYAQDGAQLFKAKCNTCHMVDKNSTGPLLKGVKQKWNDAGEGDFLYEWVKNPQTLIATGKSKVALEAKNFSPTEMSPQAVSNEEIDAILDYVDNYTPPAAAVAAAHIWFRLKKRLSSLQTTKKTYLFSIGYWSVQLCCCWQSLLCQLQLHP